MFRRETRVGRTNVRTHARRRFSALIGLVSSGLRDVQFVCLLCLAVFSFLNPRLGAATTTFTNNAVISEANSTFDGQDIVVRGATLTVDGPHAFNSLLLTNGAVLTHSPWSASQTHKLDLAVSNQVVVSPNSSINASTRGYLAGRTTGTNSGSTGQGAGSHGGLGGSNFGTVNPVYGDYANPNDWGSGSVDVSGGGLVRLTATTLILDGQILADGSGGCLGGGAGGGILISVTNIQGQGTIKAEGGTAGCFGNSNGGGGGRVALYAGDFAGFNLNHLTAPGGGNGFTPGGAGTVYVRDTDEPQGLLIIDGVNGGRNWTLLGLPGMSSFTIPDAVLIRGSRTLVGPAQADMALDFQSSVTVSNLGYLSVPSEMRISASGSLHIRTQGSVAVPGTLISGGPVVVAGATLSGGLIICPEVAATNGGILTSFSAAASQTYKLDLRVAGTLTVDAASKIDVSTQGYLAGRTSGNTTMGGATGQGAGSHGGLGGSLFGTACRVYGDYANPNDWGSGSVDVSGGGLVRVNAATLLLDGQILADGSGGCFGGGAGGGIYVEVARIQGQGSIKAEGGTAGCFGNSNGGGGGRVALYASDFTGFNLNRVMAPGGGFGFTPGGAGTVYLRDKNQPHGTLVIDGTTGGRYWTPLGLSGTNIFAISDALIIRGNRALVGAEHLNMTFLFQGALIVSNSANFSVSGDMVVPSLLVSSRGVVATTANLTSSGPVTVNGGTLAGGQISASSIATLNGGTLTSFGASAIEVHRLEIIVEGTFSVDASSEIDVSGQGYLQGRTTGNTIIGAAYGWSGGSHGGYGFVANGASNAKYGDVFDPDDWGSGGGIHDGGNGGLGGGVVRINAALFILNGGILAGGTDGGRTGGSGGSIFVSANTIEGSGYVDAYGGSAINAAGGGGRVALYAQDFSRFGTNRILASAGGLTDNSGRRASTGTVFILRGSAHTHVRTNSPAGKNGGYVNAILTNGLVLRFNKPINTNAFDSTQLLIVGPAGSISPTRFIEVSNRTYQITFPPQTENGAYHFTLLPTLLDTEGFPLDQNANGIPGEPEDTYTFTLVVDTVAPHVAQHAPAGDVSGTVRSVDVWFSEAIDKATLTPANVRFTNSLGQTIPVISISETGLSRFRFTFASQTTPATYHLVLSTNITDLAGNPLTATNPIGGGYVYDAVFNLIEVDLALANVSVSTNQLWAGDPISVSWTGRNVSGAPLLGDWVDAVYLSRDNSWDITDVRLGTVTHTGGLASNEVYSASATVNVPGALPGNYFVLIRADIANRERETVETNNVVAFGTLPLMVRTLTVDAAGVSGVLTADNRLQYFAIHVAAGESLRLQLCGGNGVNHLFVNFASIPTVLSHDFGARDNSACQTITLSGVPGGGSYYVLVFGAQVGSGGNPFQLVAETASFFVRSISPNRALRETNSLAPFWRDSLVTTVTINGAGFDRAIAVAFVASDNSVFPAQPMVDSPTVIRAVAPVAAMSPGLYSVRVTKGIVTRTLTNVFTVVGDGAHKLETRLIAPGAVSPGGGQTLYIEYANTGTRAMPAPLLKVIAYTNARVQTLASASVGGSYTPRSPRYKPVVLNSAQVMALGSGATPGIMQPGDRGRVSVRFLGLQPDRGEGSIRFALGSLTADDTTIQECPVSELAGIGSYPRTGQRGVVGTVGPNAGCPERLFTVDWNSLESSSLPPGIAADGWHAVWQNLAQNVGPLWADYVLAMGDNMNHLAAIDQLSNEPGDLFNFEVLQASGALHPIRNLVSAVDASAPAPGFPLVFRRVFGQPILSRYRLGPLGRGWTHNWDISVTNFGQSVIVRGPLGADRFFTQGASQGLTTTYTPTPGDNGTLLRIGGIFRLSEADGTSWQFDSANRLDYAEDPNGNRITCGYTAGRLSSLTHSSGKQFLLDYNGNGRLWHLTDTLGPGPADDRVTTYEYDPSGQHLATVTKPGSRITRYTYETTSASPRQHALRTVEFPDLTHNYFDYDERGRLVATSADGGAQRVTFTNDSAGTVIVQDATRRTTILKYGLGGQLAQVRDGEGRLVNFSYGDTFQLSQLLGPGGERYRYTYGASGNLTDIEDPLRQVSSFAYTNLNRLGRVLDARGHSLRYGYDSRGNLTGITYEGSTSERFAYNMRGAVIASTNRRGSVILYTNNAAGQLTAKDYSTTPGITDFIYAYDVAGNLTNTTYWNPQLSAFEAVSLRYDPATDRLKRIEYPGGKWFEFDYDPARRRTLRRDQDGHATGYTYDTAGRLDRMTNEVGQLIVDYDYDTAGRLSRKTLGNGVVTTNSYNDAGQILRLLNLKPDGSLLSSYEYSYDASGRRDSLTVTRGTGFPAPIGAGESQTYGYDPLGQLTRVEYSGGRVVEYAYDPAGNRTQVTDNGVATPYSANAVNQYSSAGAATFGYDLDGNLTNKTEGTVSTLYTYDIENRLVGVTTPMDSWSYTYDAFGNRVATTHNGQARRYVVDPTGLGNVAAEYDAGGSLLARYEHGFGLLARTDTAGNPTFYTFSAIGHTSELTDSSGAVANAYAYDPFGVSLAKVETRPNPFEFVGEFGVMNEENGLELMRARHYEAGFARFLQADPLGTAGGMNLYTYVENGPVDSFDPLGLVRWNDFFNGITTTLSGGLGLAAGVAAAPATVGVSLAVLVPVGGYKTGIGLANTILALADQEGTGLTGSIPVDLTKNSENEYLRAGGEIADLLLPDADLPGKWGRIHDLLSRYELLRQNLEIYGPILNPPDGPLQEWFSQFVRSRDPNDKLGPGGYGSAGFLAAGGVMPYQVRFENVTNASAPAQRVTVTDTLDPNLDLNTFELTEIAIANQLISIPAGLNHYETRISLLVTNGTLLPGPALNSFSATPCPSCIIAEVEAALDVPSRRLTVNLTAVDPSTGWLPEDPLLGLLFPNDSTGRGAGSVSYLVRPLPGLPSGTQIRNRAHIVFDYNDPIDTPLVFNTLDSAPPTSSVLPLHALSGRSFLVTWSGADDANGSGVASFDIYGVEDATNRFLLLQNTTETSILFTGALGHSYGFYSVARDNVGNEQTTPASLQGQTTIPTNAPVLAAISNLTINVGQGVALTNMLLNGTPFGSYVFSLGPGAPAGASVNVTNGVFRWTPTCSQASRTSVVTVVVTDTGSTNVRDTVSFSAIVGECVVPQLGRLVLRAGDSGRLPVNLISSVRLTNLAMTVEAPAGRLTNLSVEPIVAEICAATLTPASQIMGEREFYALALRTCSNQFLIGTQQVAWLNFMAVSNQSSAFVYLLLDDAAGRQPDGTEVRNFAPQAGRVVIVGEEPLLEALATTNGEVRLILYGPPGSTNLLQTVFQLPASGPWLPSSTVTLSNLFQPLEPSPAANQMRFIRAVRQ